MEPLEVKKLTQVRMGRLGGGPGPCLPPALLLLLTPEVAPWTLRGFMLSPHPGLLNLEKLLRQFLISKDTLSVRMLDDTRDPTPLLKEIRDDKTATIIIHANASMSHTILLKVGAGPGGGWWAPSRLPLNCRSAPSWPWVLLGRG